MASTDLAIVESDKFLALRSDLDHVTELITQNLGGADLGPRDLIRITVPSGKATTYRWEVPTLDGSEMVQELSGIIVHKQSTRAWWPRELGEGGGGLPPSCSSPDARIGFGKQWATPDDLDPEDDPRQQVCAQCPHGQFGSSGRGQACKQSEQLFVLMENGFLPAAISAPAMSLEPLKRYMVALSNVGLLYSQVETALGLEKATNADGIDFAKITFKRAASLSPDAAARAKAYADALRSQLQGVAVAVAADLLDPPQTPARSAARATQPDEAAVA